MRESYLCMLGVIASIAVVLGVTWPSVPQILLSLLVSATAAAGKIAGIY